MTSKAALFALLAMWGVGLGSALPARADDAPESASSETKTENGIAFDGFVNRVWQQTGTEGQPGVIRIFLSDGTLVMDSCWDTHRLASNFRRRTPALRTCPQYSAEISPRPCTAARPRLVPGFKLRLSQCAGTVLLAAGRCVQPIPVP